MTATSPLATLVAAGFAPLDTIDPSFSARATAYVLAAGEAGVLAELQSRAPRGGIKLGNPGRLMGGHPSGYGDRKLTALVDACLRARQNLYKRIRPRADDLALLIRMGHVLEAADGGANLQTGGAKVPTWCHYVLNDALWASLSPDGHAVSEAHMLAALPRWDIGLVRALLDAAGLPQFLALCIVFERDEVNAYHRDQPYRRLLLEGPLDDDMIARPDEVELLMSDLSSAGKMTLAARIGTSARLREAYGKILVRLATGESKEVRAAASRLLDAIERDACLAHLSDLLAHGSAEERANSAELLARVQGAPAVAALEAARGQESSKAVRHAIDNALSRLRVAADGADVALPPPPPMTPLPETTLADDTLAVLLENREQLRERHRLAAEQEEARNVTAKWKSSYAKSGYGRYQQLGEQHLRDAIRVLNGDPDPSLNRRRVLGAHGVHETLQFNGRVASRADFGVLQAIRWAMAWTDYADGLWFSAPVQEWVRKQDLSRLDLRQLADAAERCRVPRHVFALACLQDAYGSAPRPQGILPPDQVWPCLLEHADLIDAGLGLSAAEEFKRRPPDLAATFSALATFPVVPARWLPRIMEFALGETKAQRAAAQRVLNKLPDIGKRVVDALGSSKQELRSEAARWLVRLDYRPAVAALYAALDKETRETVSAELLTALEQLGEDITARLAPPVLLAQARKGLKAKIPAGLGWLNLDQLPACRWHDGTSPERDVDPDIVRWWVVLAAKLKEPAGNALLQRYLGLLDGPSRASLGRYLLLGFIAHDTKRPPLDEILAWARQQGAARYQQYQALAKNHPGRYAEVAAQTEEEHVEAFKRIRMGEYVGSAIGEKGILALVHGVPGHELADSLRQYCRDHYGRRAQIEALLDAASVSDDQAAIQFLLGVSRRYRTASIQERARGLVERIAERIGWTRDQLADRTIPTGGLDDNGRLSLEYGTRQFVVTLDDKLKPVLHNDAGKPVATLPAPRQDDPPEAIKEAKQLLTTCKKEIKQVVEMQTARLYEAMCTARTWPHAEWDEYLRRHPVAGRLVQRVLWIAYEDDGTAAAVFRPTEDGSLIDVDDDEVTLAASQRIGLAHAALLDEAQVNAWLGHVKDYKVNVLFGQLTRRPPDWAAFGEEHIDDRVGYVSDAFTLRGMFGKLGYQRAPAEDGGYFTEYMKDFAGAGVRVHIAFSGNALPEENVPAALKSLHFTRLGESRYGFDSPIPLATVPPVLLAEAYGDYLAVAAACAGFDPDWEMKMPW